jgi:hypothetical protein
MPEEAADGRQLEDTGEVDWIVLPSAPANGDAIASTLRTVR